METKEFFAYTTNIRQSDWSAFDKVFGKKKGAEFNLPRRWNGKDFYGDLHGLLERYVERINKDSPELLNRIEAVCAGVLETVRIYLHGYPAEAYRCMDSLMKSMGPFPMYITLRINPKREKINLYRMAKVDENVNDKSRIFHAPYDIRPKIRTYRYSIAGYPCLYLADFIELCECEMELFKNKEKAIASRFVWEDSIPINILDFGFRPQDLAESNESSKGKKESSSLNNRKKFERIAVIHRSLGQPDKLRIGAAEIYMLWYPILAACSYVRVNRNDAFAPEYLVPQLLTQYIRNEKNDVLLGIRYFSCYSEKASEKGMNYAFPTSGDPLVLKNGVKQFCPVLNEAFKLTEPEFIPDFDNPKELQDKLDKKAVDNAFPLTRNEFKGKTEVELPEGLMYIAPNTFRDCDKLKSITFPKGLLEIGAAAFENCKEIEEIKLPNGVRKLCQSAFRNCIKLKTVKLPKDIVEIESCALSGCAKLEKIEIPASVERIGGGIFEGFAAPKKVSVDENNKVFRSEGNAIIEKQTDRLIAGAMMYKNEDCVLLKTPDSVKKIGDLAFLNCNSIAKVDFPDGLEKIEKGAFYGCTGITELKLPDNLETIGPWAFKGCMGITELKLPDGLASIDPLAFEGCTGITELKLPDGLATIGSRAFEGCTGITELKLPDNLARIGLSAFEGCTGITELKLPDGLETIGAWAFDGCTGIKRIEYGGTMEQWKKVNLEFDTGIEGHTIICTDGEILPNPENPSDEKSA